MKEPTEKKAMLVHIDKHIHEQFMFKLYRIHEEQGIKITKSALVESLMKTFNESITGVTVNEK